MSISANDLQLAVAAAELVARLLPGAISIAENLVHAIQSHGELSAEEKADLSRRVKATRAKVADYEPRPHAGSPSVPEPKPTPNERPTPPGDLVIEEPEPPQGTRGF